MKLLCERCKPLFREVVDQVRREDSPGLTQRVVSLFCEQCDTTRDLRFCAGTLRGQAVHVSEEEEDTP